VAVLLALAEQNWSAASALPSLAAAPSASPSALLELRRPATAADVRAAVVALPRATEEEPSREQARRAAEYVHRVAAGAANPMTAWE